MEYDAFIDSLVEIYDGNLAADQFFSEGIKRAVERFPDLKDKISKIKKEDLGAILYGTLDGAMNLAEAISYLDYLDEDSQKLEGFPAAVAYNLHSILGSIRRGSENPYNKLCTAEAEFWNEFLGALADGAFGKLVSETIS